MKQVYCEHYWRLTYFYFENSWTDSYFIYIFEIYTKFLIDDLHVS